MAAGLGKLTGRLVFFPGMDEDQAAELTAGHDLGEVEFELVIQPQPVKRGGTMTGPAKGTIRTSVGDLPRPFDPTPADMAGETATKPGAPWPTRPRGPYDGDANDEG